MGRVVPVTVLLVFEVLEELLVLRVLIVRGGLAVLGGFALVFIAMALVVVLRVRKRARIVWSVLVIGPSAVLSGCSPTKAGPL